jgi:hypothetical protein
VTDREVSRVCTSEDKSAQKRLVYDPRGLPGVTTARPGVGGVLQMVSEPTIAVSRARTVQLRRIRWRTGQGRGYIRITRGSSGRDTVWYVCY